MNFRQLAEDLGLEEDEFLEVAELFVETTISDLDKINTAIMEGDAQGVASAAHSIKGAAGNLGLMELQEEAGKIEESARSNRLDGTAEAAQGLKRKLDEITRAVEKLSNRTRGEDKES